MRDVKHYTNRWVVFTPDDKMSDLQADQLVDAACEYFWGWRWYLGQTSIGIYTGNLAVSNLPWWLPSWYARRRLATFAWDLGLWGSVASGVEREVYGTIPEEAAA
jgi:hypothetical protein